MKYIVYDIKLLEPALPGTLAGDPNSSAALGYLPGSVLRGACIAKYKRSHGGAFDPTDAKVRRLFFENSTRYLNGYVFDEVTKRRSLPKLLSWYQDKSKVAAHEEGKSSTLLCIMDAAVEPLDDEGEWKSASGQFWSCYGDRVYFIDTTFNLAVHTLRDRNYGRAMPRTVSSDGRVETRGAVYRYEALAEGQTFRAAIVCDNDEDADILADLLPGRVSIGKSRSSQYGSAEITIADVIDDWSESKGEFSNRACTEIDSSMHIIALLSDTILRTADGSYVSTKENFADALGVACGLSGIECKSAYFKTGIMGGFNRKWKMPLPQEMTLGMGSVFCLTGVTDVVALRRLEKTGIGERINEGFGRIALDVNSTFEIEVSEAPEMKHLSNHDKVLLDPASKRLAQAMACRIEKSRLLKAIADKSRHYDIGRNMNASQIGRLRNKIQACLFEDPAEGREELLHYIEDVQKRQTVRKQFDQKTIDWLTKFILNKDDIWVVLACNEAVCVAGVDAERNDNLAYEYNLRLIDAVLAELAKKKKEGGQGDE